MSEHSYAELIEYHETVVARIQSLHEKLEELEDVMNSGDEQIVISDRIENLQLKLHVIEDEMLDHPDLAGLEYD